MNLDGNYCVDCDASIPPRAKRCAICALDANKRRASLRKEPSLSEKLAAMILLHLKIPHDQAKLMPISKILGLVQWDHYPVRVELARELDWSRSQVNHPSNLQPLIEPEHLEKTRKIDTPQAAKGKRLTKAHEGHRRRMLAPDKTNGDKPKSKWPQGRKFQSRPFPSR